MVFLNRSILLIINFKGFLAVDVDNIIGHFEKSLFWL